MLEIIDGFDDGTVAIRGAGIVTAGDYERVLVPAVARATSDGRRARLLLEFGEGFDGYDASAALADAGLGIGHLGSFDRIAVVTDADWLRRAIHLFGGLIKGDVRLFATADAAAAHAWIRDRGT